MRGNEVRDEAVYAVNSDFFGVADFLGDADRALVARVRGFVGREVLPVINEYWERADFPYQILPGLAVRFGHGQYRPVG
jgi:hypothetical protein